MNKTFKRLLSLVMVLLMIVGIIPVSGMSSVSAADSYTVYYKKTTIDDPVWDNAAKIYIYGFNDTSDNSGGLMAMEYNESAGVYSYTFTKQYQSVIFAAQDTWLKEKSTQTVDLTVPWSNYSKPCFTLNGGFDSDTGSKEGDWSNNITPAAFAGKTVYVTGVTGVPNVSQASTFDTSTPLYNATTGEWKAYTAPITEVTIKLKLPANNAYVWFVKDETKTRSAQSYADGDTFTYNLLKHDSFYVGWYDNNEIKTGNITAEQTNDMISKQFQAYTSPVFIVGGTYTKDVNRSGTWADENAIGDASLNIPSVDSYTKEDDSYYVTSTFYDYYSDVELTGVNRKTLTGKFDLNSGSNDKIQARTFNTAVGEYFKTNQTNNTEKYKPLYFGEFESINDSNYYYNYDKKYNNSVAYGNQAHQGLVDNTLKNGNITMGGVELPYFNEAFLRGNNSTGTAIGKVFAGVQFPFKENNEGYWEFDSIKADQSLRMKQTSDGTYFLDRTNVAVNAADGSAVSTGEPGFFPFNDSSESGNAKQLNYGFGVRFDIPFSMTEDGKIQTNDTSENIVYKFSGDDDVWVFIDNELVLDIGGDHGRIYGQIDFGAEGGMVATVYQNGSQSEAKYTNTFDRPSSSKQHTLTMFYMERGLWESNMKITFNFPRINTLAVNKEVDTSDVNEMFLSFGEDENTVSLADSLASVNVEVENYATRGTDKDVDSTGDSYNQNYNLLEKMDKVSFTGSPSQTGITTDTNNKSGRASVLMVKYPAQLKDDKTNAATHRAVIKPQDGDTFDATGAAYLQFDMFNEGQGSRGVPYVELKDSAGNTVGGYATGSYAYDNSNNALTRNTWVTVKVDLLNLISDKRFHLNNISEIQIGYWDSGYIFLDNITIRKSNVLRESVNKFATKQYEVPTYGSIKAEKLTKAIGAIYEQQRAGTTNTKYIDESGSISLVNGETALFTDQFRIGSYISLKENANQDYYTTSWKLEEGSRVYASGNGTVIDDGRTELKEYAAETEQSGHAMAWNDADKPNNAFLYRSSERTDDIITPTNLSATFVNEVDTDSLKITKNVSDEDKEKLGAGATYNFKVTFSNIFGQIDEEVVEEDIVLEAGESITIEGIPVGTNYVIEEIIEENAKYKVTNIEHKNVKDSGSADLENAKYAGIVSIGEDVDTANPDEIVFTNAQIPEQMNKVFYVESGKTSDLVMNLQQLTYMDEVANPSEKNAGTHAVVGVEKDGTNVKFDKATDGDDKPIINSVDNEAYTFYYSGRDANQGAVEGTVTVYTFKANNDIYVFDYGLKSNLSDNTDGYGLFANDVLFNQYAEGTTAKLNGLAKDDNEVAVETWDGSADKEQSKITCTTNTSLTQISDATGATIADEDKQVWFTPGEFMDTKETSYYQTWVLASKDVTEISSAADGVKLNASITTMPANSVYYEDNFNAEDTTTNDGSIKIIYTNSDSKPEKNPDGTQSNDQSENYGQDDEYADDLKESGGSSTVMNSGDGAYFTFKGNGFDIVSRTNEETAGMIVYVFEGKKTQFSDNDFKANADGTKPFIKAIAVDTYYSNGDLYQVPVISSTMDAWDEYTVYIKALSTYTGQSVIYIDGVRIYNPLNDQTSDYLDTEEKVTVSELRSLYKNSKLSLVTWNDTLTSFNIGAGATYVELYGKPEVGAYKGAKTLDEVINNGPNNELYMPLDNGIAFVINKWGAKDWTLQIGAKSVSPDDLAAEEGETAEAVNKTITVYVKPDDANIITYEPVKTYEVNTSTDMYYDIAAADFQAAVEKYNKTAEEDSQWSLATEKWDVVILNSTVDFNIYDIVSLTTLKYNGSYIESATISQTTSVGYNLRGRNVQKTEEERILSADFDVTNVTRGKYTSMTVVTKDDVEDLKIVDPTENEVTSFRQKTSNIDANGNKVWNLTFKVIKVKGDAVYKVSAVVGGEETGNPYPASIAIR